MDTGFLMCVMSLDHGIYLPGKELQDFSKQRKTDRETAI